MKRLIVGAGALVAGLLQIVPLSVVSARQQARADTTENDYRYERYVRPGAPGPNRLPVDLPLLTGSRPFSVVSRMSGIDQTAWLAEGGLHDLRFYDEQRREVPYLLIPPAPRAPDWTTGRILPILPTKKTSGFEVDLGGVSVVDALSLTGLPAPYLKRARLEGSGDRTRWTLLSEEATLFDLPDEKLTRQEVDFPAGEYRYLRVTWDDTNSARVPLPRAGRARRATRDSAPPSLRAELTFERRVSEPGVSRYRVVLPGPHLPIVAMELNVGSGYVLRRARIVESRLDEGEMRPVMLGTGVLRRAVREGVAAADLRIPVTTPRERQVELVVEDGNNPPLDLAGISAVCATLPWIYFESASGRPILARFGSSNAAPPRYDLEAARPAVPRARLADAAWGERLDLAPAAAAVAATSVPVLGAPLDAASFSHRRAIPAGPRGLTALRLDAAALAHGAFADLRIATPDNRQVAYLVERLDEPLALDLPLPERTAPPSGGLPPPGAGAQTCYRLALPYAGLPAARLVLGTTARVFTRTVRVLVEQDDARSRGGKRYDVVAQSAWQHADPESNPPPLTLALPGLSSTGIWLVVEEGDNSPIPLGRPTLLLPAYRLRFFRETDERLSLLYGNARAAAPRYDLALLAPRLVGASAHEVSAEPENGAPPASQAVTATRVFWGALVVAVVILAVLLARLVKA